MRAQHRHSHGNVYVDRNTQVMWQRRLAMTSGGSASEWRPHRSWLLKRVEGRIAGGHASVHSFRHICFFFLTHSSEAPSHSLSVTVFTVSLSLTPKSHFGGWVVVWAGAWVVRFVSHSMSCRKDQKIELLKVTLQDSKNREYTNFIF